MIPHNGLKGVENMRFSGISEKKREKCEGINWRKEWETVFVATQSKRRD
jgi:hypothetical protein